MTQNIRLRTRIAAVMGLWASLMASSAQAAVAWADFVATPIVAAVPMTVALGSGSTIRIALTTGGTRHVSPSDQGTLGVAETGLPYTHFNMFGLFNGGGVTSVTTTITLSNFVPGPGHQRSLIAVGALASLSSGVTATSSRPGAVQLWEAVGSPFDFGSGNSAQIGWNPSTGKISQNPNSPFFDSKIIVIDVGSIAPNETIQLTLEQLLNDGVVFAFGEESSTAATVPALGPLALAAATILLLATGVAGMRPLSQIRSSKP